MLPQVQPLEKPLQVGRKNFLRRLAGVYYEEGGDEPFDDVCVAVPPKRHFGRLGTLDGDEPDLTQTPWDQVILIPEFFRIRLKLPSKLYEVPITVLPREQPVEALCEFVGSHRCMKAVEGVQWAALRMPTRLRRVFQRPQLLDGATPP